MTGPEPMTQTFRKPLCLGTLLHLKRTVAVGYYPLVPACLFPVLPIALLQW